MKLNPFSSVSGVALTVCAILAAMGVTAPAQALPSMNATMGGSFDNADYAGDGTAGTNLGNTTTLTMDGTGSILSLPPNYTPLGGSSAPNTYLSLNILSAGQSFTSVTSISLAGITNSPAVDNIPDLLSYTGSAGTYTFSATELYISSVDGNGSSITIGVVGVLADESGHYADTPGLALINFQQSGNAGAVADDVTLGAPPSVEVPPLPEPASIFLVGSGLLGLNVIRRRRKD
jgi:hypothetical protein